MRRAAPPPQVAHRLETERLLLLKPQRGDLDIGHWDTHRFGLWMMRDRESGALVGRGGWVHTIVGGAGEVGQW